MNSELSPEEKIRFKEVGRLFALAAIEMARKEGLPRPDNMDRKEKHLTCGGKKIKYIIKTKRRGSNGESGIQER